MNADCFVVVLRGVAGSDVPVEVRLRRALKALRRRYGLRVISVAPAAAKAAP